MTPKRYELSSSEIGEDRMDRTLNTATLVSMTADWATASLNQLNINKPNETIIIVISGGPPPAPILHGISIASSKPLLCFSSCIMFRFEITSATWPLTVDGIAKSRTLFWWLNYWDGAWMRQRYSARSSRESNTLDDAFTRYITFTLVLHALEQRLTPQSPPVSIIFNKSCCLLWDARVRDTITWWSSRG